MQAKLTYERVCSSLEELRMSAALTVLDNARRIPSPAAG